MPSPKEEKLKVTYATSSVEDPSFHERFEEALSLVRRKILRQEFPALVGGKKVFPTRGNAFTKKSPINTSWDLGSFPLLGHKDAEQAVLAAKKALSSWSGLPWKRRVKILRKVADLVDKEVFTLSAVTALEVGKNRLEAFGDVSEVSALIRYYCDQMEENNGYITPMLSPGGVGRNVSVMKPFGVWGVISPFNFPAALAGGPMAAALLAGNTVVFKPASETPLIGYLLVKLFHQVGVPPKALSFITGSGGEVGEAMVGEEDVAGLTFTGSYAVGMEIYHKFAQRRWLHPLVLEMGGKNAAVVSRRANLELAAQGIVRSAFGLSGQKCSACSRVFVEKSIYKDLVGLLLEKTGALKVGDPTQREVFMGPVINRGAYEKYQRFIKEFEESGQKIVFGGRVLTGGGLNQGYFVEPAIVEISDPNHPLFQEELFSPLVGVYPVRNLAEALRLTNESRYGLTGGFYSRDQEEVEEYLREVEAGVVYVNRAAGATTGAWPGQQPFGGWKASGSTGRGGGGKWYLLSYLREQSQTAHPA